MECLCLHLSTQITIGFAFFHLITLLCGRLNTNSTSPWAFQSFILKIRNKIKRPPHKCMLSQNYFDLNKIAIDSGKSTVNRTMQTTPKQERKNFGIT